jgi:hypothetical protein
MAISLSERDSRLDECDAGVDFGRIIQTYEKEFEKVYRRILPVEAQEDLRKNGDSYLIDLMKEEIPGLFEHELKGDNQRNLTALFYLCMFLNTKKESQI